MTTDHPTYRVTDLSEFRASTIMNYLGDDLGFMYDEDFTALYGDEWQITGIKAMGPRGTEVMMVITRLLED